MGLLSRRDCVGALIALLAGARCSRGDRFARQLVCNHIFELNEPLPPPLLSAAASDDELRPAAAEFDIGLPELMACTTTTRFLEVFRTFWPVRRADIERLRAAVTVAFELPAVRAPRDVEAFAAALAGLRRRTPRGAPRIVAVFTLHGETRRFMPPIARAALDGGAEELILFKDPSIPPYFCDYPARQEKGW